MAGPTKCSECEYYTASKNKEGWGRCHAKAPVPVGYGADETVHEIIVPRPLVFGEDKACADSKKA